MVAQAFRDVETRHRLLEGFLQRLAQSDDVDAFALRGGMLVRHWFPEVGRTASDIDLVCQLRYEREEIRQRVAKILRVSMHDGVHFEPERFRLDALRPSSRHPGMRLFAAGRVDGWSAEMSVDLTFDLDVWPTAQQQAFQTERGEAAIWLCQPEMLIGRKLQVTSELGRPHWRPKDLGDLCLMLRRFSLQTEVLGEAVDRSFEGEPAPHRLDDLFASTAWWQLPQAHARWSRYIRHNRVSLDRNLDAVVSEVRTHLRPILRTP